MLEALVLILLLLPVAAASGWYLRGQMRRPEEQQPNIHPDYLLGISHLVNEDADKAIEVFMRLLDVDNETVETHLALGNLFRRQGEVDRALRVHQNLIARPKLEPIHRNQARFELAKDYLRAGVLDRSEKLFSDLVEQGMFLEPALSGLVSIYEQGREWQQAIDTTRRLESVRGHMLRPITAQYYCEMADDASHAGNTGAASQYARSARGEFRDCVRSSLILGDIATVDEKYAEAIKSYRRVLKQDADFITEILQPLQVCYRKLDDMQGYHRFLQEAIRRHDGPAPHVAMARFLQQQGNNDEAIGHLSEYIQSNPSWLAFYHLLELTAAVSRGGLTGTLNSLRESLHEMIESQPLYLCGHCGFAGRYRYWQCPSCKQWNSTAPVRDIQPATG